jgi:glycosyltransferase involved in cell wall biosynthesis
VVITTDTARHMIPVRTDGSVTIAARSPGLDVAAIEIVVTMPTFRRPRQVLETLDSLRRQTTNRHFAVIVMENDAERAEGVAALKPLFEAGEAAGLLIVAHERGNCSAYNAGWETALMQFPSFRHLAVIDDDELAHPDWLENMCLAAERFGADIVGGPQLPIFPDGTDPRWATHPVFAPPYTRSGPVPALYSSGNLLISRDVLARMGPPFLDLRFNFLGGGDSDFLSRSSQAGFKLAWCAEAPVSETVPPRRLEGDWIRARSLRNGVISTLVQKRRDAGKPLGRLRVTAKSLALLAVSPLRALKLLARTRWPSHAAYPILVASGRLLAEFGYSNEQYRQPEKN